MVHALAPVLAHLSISFLTFSTSLSVGLRIGSSRRRGRLEPIHHPVMEFAPARRAAPSRAALRPPAPLSRGAGSFPASQRAPGSPLLPPRSHPALVAVEVGLRLVPSALGDFLAELEPPDVAVRDVDAAEQPRHARLLGGLRKCLP